jgi:hypothetical protein
MTEIQPAAHFFPPLTSEPSHSSPSHARTSPPHSLTHSPSPCPFFTLSRSQVHFNRDKALKKEIHLVGNSDVTLSIVEPLTSNKEETVPIKISARAVFSK